MEKKEEKKKKGMSLKGKHTNHSLSLPVLVGSKNKGCPQAEAERTQGKYKMQTDFVGLDKEQTNLSAQI